MTSRFSIVGAGGLGGPIAYALAAAGARAIAIWDDDRVELSNLHRQVLYGTADVGRRDTDAGEGVSAGNEHVIRDNVAVLEWKDVERAEKLVTFEDQGHRQRAAAPSGRERHARGKVLKR